MQDNLDYITRFNRPNALADKIIIWLHGLGASCNDFEPLVTQMRLTGSFKFIFPNAPLRPVTLNNGYIMRAWYDLYDLTNFSHNTDAEGINNSVTQIDALIANQIKLGFDSEQIIIGGFSQGGAIAYVSAINSHYKLAGVITLSCYLPKVAIKLDNSINKKTPFLTCHGTSDQVVPYHEGLSAFEYLKQHGYNIKLEHYSIAHSVCDKEIYDIAAWINNI